MGSVNMGGIDQIPHLVTESLDREDYRKAILDLTTGVGLVLLTLALRSETLKETDTHIVEVMEKMTNRLELLTEKLDRLESIVKEHLV